MSITLFCLVKGDTFVNDFSVDIGKNQLIGHLRQGGNKSEKQNDFASMDADKLQLWKVMISSDHND